MIPLIYDNNPRGYGSHRARGGTSFLNSQNTDSSGFRTFTYFACRRGAGFRMRHFGSTLRQVYHVCEYVQASTMRHAHHDVLNTKISRCVNQLFHSHNQHLFMQTMRTMRRVCGRVLTSQPSRPKRFSADHLAARKDSKWSDLSAE